MKISDNGISLISNFEGLRLLAYTDSVGVWTIGIGHTGTVDGKAIYSGMEISKDKAYEVFRSDVSRFEECVNNSVVAPINQNQFDALVSFCFNVGAGAFDSSDLLFYLNLKEYEKAGNEFLQWVYASGVKLEGLARRRRAERELFLKEVRPMIPMFSDIGKNDPAYNHIKKLQDAGIVNGHTDGTFKPDDKVTRRECAVMVANVLNYLGK